MQILSILQTSSYEDIAVRAAFTLAFAGFLRVGEFTYRGTDHDLELGPAFPNWFQTKGCIRIIAQGQHIELTLPASKTDPFSKEIKLIIASSGDEACPVQAMKQLFAIDTHWPLLAPLFYISKYDQRPFSREYVVQKLQTLAIFAGLGTGTWNGHSLHRGAATWAAEVGIPEKEIQTLGRWRSEAYMAYIEYSRDEQISLSKLFQKKAKCNHPLFSGWYLQQVTTWFAKQSLLNSNSKLR